MKTEQRQIEKRILSRVTTSREKVKIFYLDKALNLALSKLLEFEVLVK